MILFLQYEYEYSYHHCPPVRATVPYCTTVRVQQSRRRPSLWYSSPYAQYFGTRIVHLPVMSTVVQSRRRPSLHQASVKKGGPRGVSPLVRSGGGLKNRRFPPPHPSDDNVLYSIFAPCLVLKYMFHCLHTSSRFDGHRFSSRQSGRSGLGRYCR